MAKLTKMKVLVDKYYAIGFRDWVEVRMGPAPPDKNVTESSGEFPYTESVFDPGAANGWGSYKEVTGKRKLTFKAVVYNGGKVLFTLPKEKFRYAIDRAPGKDDMFEITAEETERLLAYAKKIGKY